MSQFDEWLRALRAAGKLVENIPPATRGMSWVQDLEVEGDWSDYALSGTIRIAPDAQDALAQFVIVSGPIYADGVTSYRFGLPGSTGPNTTGSLPGDSDLDGVVRLPCSLRLTPSGGEAELLFGGIFTVLGYV